MAEHRVYSISVASVYPHYIAKAEKKGRTKAEVDEIIRWLTGFSQDEFNAHLEKKTDFETFFAQAPRLILVGGSRRAVSMVQSPNAPPRFEE